MDQFPLICAEHREFQALLYTIVLTSDTTTVFPVHPWKAVLKSKADIREEEADNKKPKKSPWVDSQSLAVLRVFSL